MTIPKFITFWKRKARELKALSLAMVYAYRDPRTPWYAKVAAALVAAYAFSPIDLIPDFIPVLGYLDDLVIVPLGVFLSLRLIPPAVMAECRLQAEQRVDDPAPAYRIMGIVVVAMWIIIALAAGVWLLKIVRGK